MIIESLSLYDVLFIFDIKLVVSVMMRMAAVSYTSLNIKLTQDINCRR